MINNYETNASLKTSHLNACLTMDENSYSNNYTSMASTSSSINTSTSFNNIANYRDQNVPISHKIEYFNNGQGDKSLFYQKSFNINNTASCLEDRSDQENEDNLSQFVLKNDLVLYPTHDLKENTAIPKVLPFQHNNGGSLKRGCDDVDGETEDDLFTISSSSMGFGRRSPPKKPKFVVTYKEMKEFFTLLSEESIQEFLKRDSCCLITDKYALAMVFTYFKRAKFYLNEFTRINFYLALYLASDIEEDVDEYKYEIFPWALGSRWRSKFSCFLRKRDALLRRIGYRAIVSRKCCEEVMSLVPDHSAWKRERSEDHGGATRAYLINRSRRFLSSKNNLDEEEIHLPRGPHEKPRPCPLCLINRGTNRPIGSSQHFYRIPAPVMVNNPLSSFSSANNSIAVVPLKSKTNKYDETIDTTNYSNSSCLVSDITNDKIEIQDNETKPPTQQMQLNIKFPSATSIESIILNPKCDEITSDEDDENDEENDDDEVFTKNEKPILKGQKAKRLDHLSRFSNKRVLFQSKLFHQNISNNQIRKKPNHSYSSNSTISTSKSSSTITERRKAAILSSSQPTDWTNFPKVTGNRPKTQQV